MIGMGAANLATFRLLKASGVDPASIIACDTKGTLHRGRRDLEALRVEFTDKWRVCLETNGEGATGGVPDALRGADVCIAFARANSGTIKPEWVQTMARDAIVFACANPTPEIWPWDAKTAGARIVGTGRGDFPNQINNSLVFPGVLRGALDVRARTISDSMAITAAHELAEFAQRRGIHEEDIVPRMDEWEVYASVAAAVAMRAQQEGLARVTLTRDEAYWKAASVIRDARGATQILMREGLIPAMPAIDAL
jgi:malate dehydrogenase (oxaloacetate-decarboxylating)